MRPLVLTIWAENSGPETMQLTCSTVGGNVAATLQWPSDAPVQNLAQSIMEAVASSGFDCSIKPLGVWNHRLSKPGQHGTLLALGAESLSLAQKLGLTSSASSEGPAQGSHDGSKQSGSSEDSAPERRRMG